MTERGHNQAFQGITNFYIKKTTSALASVITSVINSVITSWVIPDPYLLVTEEFHIIRNHIIELRTRGKDGAKSAGEKNEVIFPKFVNKQSTRFDRQRIFYNWRVLHTRK